MLEEQLGTNYRLSGELAAKEEQMLRLKQALDQRRLEHQGNYCKHVTSTRQHTVDRYLWLPHSLVCGQYANCL